MLRGMSVMKLEKKADKTKPSNDQREQKAFGSSNDIDEHVDRSGQGSSNLGDVMRNTPQFERENKTKQEIRKEKIQQGQNRMDEIKTHELQEAKEQFSTHFSEAMSALEQRYQLFKEHEKTRVVTQWRQLDHKSKEIVDKSVEELRTVGRKIKGKWGKLSDKVQRVAKKMDVYGRMSAMEKSASEAREERAAIREDIGEMRRTITDTGKYINNLETHLAEIRAEIDSLKTEREALSKGGDRSPSPDGSDRSLSPVGSDSSLYMTAIAKQVDVKAKGKFTEVPITRHNSVREEVEGVESFN
jgi:uncharacterized coiled-coil DUF342 family protein